MIKFPRAEYWDILGVGTFTAITLLSGWSITTGAPIPQWGLMFLFFVGIFGIFVDGTIVDKTFIRKNN